MQKQQNDLVAFPSACCPLHPAYEKEFLMDWDQLSKEAILSLQQYLQINTVNPPGNEIGAARFFKRIFDDHSIPCQLFEPSPGRGNVLATLKGNGAQRPVLLLSHMDVVPAEKETWEVDPLQGSLKRISLRPRGP